MRFFLPLMAVAGMAAAKSAPQSQPRNVFDRRQVGVDVCADVTITLPTADTLCDLPAFGGALCPLGAVGIVTALVAALDFVGIGASAPLLDICLCLDGTALSASSLTALNVQLTQEIGTPGSVLNLVSGAISTALPVTLEVLFQQIAVNILEEVECTYPANSFPICGDVCDFDCNEGFIRCGDVCIEGEPGDLCPSGTIDNPTRRRSIRKDLDCPFGKSACAIPDMRGRFECLDTRFDVESCGGCTFPLPGYQKGVDCTALPHVVDVECINSRCVIQSCAKGFHFNGLSCVNDRSAIGQVAVEATEETTGSGLTGIFIKGLGRVVSNRRAERYKREEAKAVYAARQASSHDVASRGKVGGA